MDDVLHLLAFLAICQEKGVVEILSLGTSIILAEVSGGL